MKTVFLTLMFLLMTQSLYAGSITGKVTFDGDPLDFEEEISMGADPTCMAAHDGEVYAETVIADASGGLKNVFAYLKEGVTGTHEAPADPATIDQKGCMYSPHVFGMHVNQDLKIVNSDNTLHNVHSLSENSKQFNLGMPLQGMTLTKNFEASEVMVKVKCDVHPWMNAYIGVVDHPYFAVSGDDGSFTIDNVPAGDYVLEIWHEELGSQTQPITVADAAVTADFTLSG